MTTISRETWISAPRQKVWAALADFGNIYLISPTVLNSYLTTEQKTGIGATRHCDLTLFGASLEERITDWQEGRSLKIDIYAWKNLPIIKEMGAEFTLREKQGGTVLKAELQYSVKYGLPGRLMNALMLKPQNTRGWTTFLAGIRHHIETGKSIDKDTTLDVTPVTVVKMTDEMV